MSRVLWSIKQTGIPGGRIGHAMAFDAVRGRTVMFGGNSGAGPLADTWQWDGSGWTQVNDLGPSARFGHAMTYDPDRAAVVLFGGGDGGELSGDTWEWNGLDWTQVADDGPSARAGTSLAFAGTNNGVLLFGGEDESGVLADTWRWNGEEWVQLDDVGPPARRDHVMTFDTQRQRLVLFGGEGGATVRGDTWEWDGSLWTRVANFGPPPAVGAAMIFDGESCILYGGNSGSSESPAVYSVTWQRAGNYWTARQNMGPGLRWGHAMSFDSRRDRIVLFGGSSTVESVLAPLADTWEIVARGATTPGPDEQPEGPAIRIASLRLDPETPIEGRPFWIIVSLDAPTPAPLHVDLELPVPPGTILRSRIQLPAGTDQGTLEFPLALYADVFHVDAMLDDAVTRLDFRVQENSNFRALSLKAIEQETETGRVAEIVATLNAPTPEPLNVPIFVHGPEFTFFVNATAAADSNEARTVVELEARSYGFEAILGGGRVSTGLQPLPLAIRSLEIVPASVVEGNRFDIVATLNAEASSPVRIPFRLGLPYVGVFEATLEIASGSDSAIYSFPHALFAGIYGLTATLSDNRAVGVFEVIQEENVRMLRSLRTEVVISADGAIAAITAQLSAAAPRKLSIPLIVWEPEPEGRLYMDQLVAEPASTTASGQIKLGAPGEYWLEARLGGAIASGMALWTPS